MVIHHQGHTFEIRSEPSGPHRPDTTWRYIDPAGHHHQWEWPAGQRDQSQQQASLPTCTVMQTVEYIEGEEFRNVRYECSLCHAPIEPGRVQATTRRTFWVDGNGVTEAEFRARMEKVGLPPSNF